MDPRQETETVSDPTHQTVRLSRGKHTSPRRGACVMELASLLAGEPFSDRPDCVCPVIAAFLRAYNDSIDDHRRQDLYAYAAEVVGSRACSGVEQARVERLNEWAEQRRRSSRTRRLLPPWLRAIAFCPASGELAGTVAAHSIRRHTDETHAAALGLLDELLRIPSGVDHRFEINAGSRTHVPGPRLGDERIEA
jgi:hypothetical protein